MCKVTREDSHHLVNDRHHSSLVYDVSVVSSVHYALLDRDYLVLNLRRINIALIDVELVERELVNCDLVFYISVLDCLQQLVCFRHVHVCHAFLQN